MQLSQKRLEYQPTVPASLKDFASLTIKEGKPTSAEAHVEDLQKHFPKTFGAPVVDIVCGNRKQSEPLRIGVVFSGGQASGGHNVICGLFDALKMMHSDSILYGFLGGPSGIIENNQIELSKEKVAAYRNQGGFDMIASGRTKIETKDQLKSSLKTVQELKLNGLVVIGGDDSNTNAAILAEYFLNHGCTTQVIGVPKTIDGDLRNAFVAVSFGFDTACKTYSEMIGNICRDALSAKKYYHFIKLMGRSASHIALECANRTHPNFVLVGEEVAEKKKTLEKITQELCDMICARAERGKNFGVVLIPEGLIEFIPEIKKLIGELNHQLSQKSDVKGVIAKLSDESKKCFENLPEKIQEQLLIDRDPHGNVQVSKIETENLLLDIARRELKKREEKGKYKEKFSPVQHFFGYEGRSCLPSNFDANYCYSLGRVAALLIREGKTGYMACVTNLTQPVVNWEAKGIPITMLMNMEVRKGKEKPVIKKALVDLKGKLFQQQFQNRIKWGLEDDYLYPGPIQFFGETEITDETPLILRDS